LAAATRFADARKKKSITGSSSNDGEFGHVDEDVGARHGVGQSFTSEHVGARRARRGDDVVTVALEQVDHLRTDKAGGPDNCDLHTSRLTLTARSRTLENP
jgi:hypothetical protein